MSEEDECVALEKQIARALRDPVGEALKEITQLLVVNSFTGPNILSLAPKVLKVEIALRRRSEKGAWFMVYVGMEGLKCIQCDIPTFLKDMTIYLPQVLVSMGLYFEGHFFVMYSPPTPTERGLVCGVQLEDGDSKRVHVTTYEDNEPARCPAMQLKVFQDYDHCLDEFHRFHKYLKNLKLFHPEVEVRFLSDFTMKKIDDSLSLTTTQHVIIQNKQLISDSKYYLRTDQQDNDNNRFVPKVSPITKLEPVSLSNDLSDKRLQLSCMAAIVPCPEEHIDINRLCTRIKVSFFGPQQMPLFFPNSVQNQSFCREILQLKDYGLNVGPVVNEDVLQTSGLGADFCYRLTVPQESEESPDKTPVDMGQLDCPEAESGNLTIFLFVVMDYCGVDCTDVTVIYECLNNLRHKLPSIVHKTAAKFRQSCNSVLSKLLQNYTVADQRQSLYHIGIPNLVDDIADIFKFSTNDSFRKTCSKLFNVKDAVTLRGAVSGHLWDIIQDRFSIHPRRSAASRRDYSLTRRHYKRGGQSEVQEEPSRKNSRQDSTNHTPSNKPSFLPMPSTDSLNKQVSRVLQPINNQQACSQAKAPPPEVIMDVTTPVKQLPFKKPDQVIPPTAGTAKKPAQQDLAAGASKANMIRPPISIPRPPSTSSLFRNVSAQRKHSRGSELLQNLRDRLEKATGRQTTVTDGFLQRRNNALAFRASKNAEQSKKDLQKLQTHEIISFKPLHPVGPSTQMSREVGQTMIATMLTTVCDSETNECSPTRMAAGSTTNNLVPSLRVTAVPSMTAAKVKKTFEPPPIREWPEPRAQIVDVTCSSATTFKTLTPRQSESVSHVRHQVTLTPVVNTGNKYSVGSTRSHSMPPGVRGSQPGVSHGGHVGSVYSAGSQVGLDSSAVPKVIGVRQGWKNIFLPQQIGNIRVIKTSAKMSEFGGYVVHHQAPPHQLATAQPAPPRYTAHPTPAGSSQLTPRYAAQPMPRGTIHHLPGGLVHQPPGVTVQYRPSATGLPAHRPTSDYSLFKKGSSQGAASSVSPGSQFYVRSQSLGCQVVSTGGTIISQKQRPQAGTSFSAVVTEATNQLASNISLTQMVARQLPSHLIMAPPPMIDHWDILSDCHDDILDWTCVGSNEIVNDELLSHDALLPDDSVVHQLMLLNESLVQQPMMSNESFVHQPMLLNESMVHQPMLSNESLVHQPMLSNESLVQQPMLSNESLVHQPMLSNESLFHQPMLSNESLFHQPMMSNESLVHQPMLLNESFVHQPMLSNESLVHQPMLLNESLVHQPMLSNESVVHQPMLPRSSVIQQVLLSDETQDKQLINEPATLLHGNVEPLPEPQHTGMGNTTTGSSGEGDLSEGRCVPVDLPPTSDDKTQVSVNTFFDAFDSLDEVIMQLGLPDDLNDVQPTFFDCDLDINNLLMDLEDCDLQFKDISA